MNKKKCPQCKNQILITAPTCLYCGRPNKFVTENYVNDKWNKINKKNYYINKNNNLLKKNLIFLSLIILLILLIYIIF